MLAYACPSRLFFVSRLGPSSSQVPATVWSTMPLFFIAATNQGALQRLGMVMRSQKLAVCLALVVGGSGELLLDTESHRRPLENVTS